MRILTLASKEADFSKNLTDSSGFKWKETVGTFDYCRQLYGKTDYFYPQLIRKKRIIIHGTAGECKGDIAQLSQPGNHVSVPFVIARDGTVYQLFDPEACAYHLGPSTLYANKDMSFSSIGIELSNLLCLTLKGNTLVDSYGKDYCTLADTEHYVKIPAFRGYSYYASFTIEQYRALDTLLLDLCRKYHIVHSFIPLEERFDVNIKQAQLAGISHHANWRKDKYDMADGVFDFTRISGR